MSTSEIEPAKIDLKTTKKLNGWWRIWIVVSIIWIIFAVAYAIAGWFDDGLNKETAKHYQIYQNLDSTNKLMVFESEIQSPAEDIQRVQLITENIIIPFKPGIQEKSMLEFAELYCKIGNQIQFGNRSKFILIALTFCIIPPSTLFILGKSIAWIIKGFKS
jgi:hypothetical protein